MTHRRTLDRILSAQLSGWPRHGPVDAAVDELRGMANGRGDLLAEQAGLMIDAVSVRPVTAEYRAAVKLLIAARRRGGPARPAGSRWAAARRVPTG
jgi:hypothetical protein